MVHIIIFFSYILCIYVVCITYEMYTTNANKILAGVMEDFQAGPHAIVAIRGSVKVTLNESPAR